MLNTYEGAEEIPGRPQKAVDALILANDIYDDTALSSVGLTRSIPYCNSAQAAPLMARTGMPMIR